MGGMISMLWLIPLGWVAGGVINTISDELPARRRLGRPFCVACGRTLPWERWMLPRVCPQCGRRPGLRTWLVHVYGLLVTIWIGTFHLPWAVALVWLLWAIYLAVVVVIDVEHRLILHPVSWAGVVLGGFSGTWLHGIRTTLLGGIGGFLILYIFYGLGEWFMRWMARRRGEAMEEVALGFGDVNLAGVLGLLLGWPGVISGIFLGILLSGGASLILLFSLIIRRSYRPFQQALPMGPFLVLGAAMTLLMSRAVLW